MTVKEIERAENRITGDMMYLCVDPHGTLCLMIRGIRVKNGEKARERFEYLKKK